MSDGNAIRSSGQSRTPLSRERALAAAVALADERGIRALTMRGLARELGVEAMSLYHHVANKDDILDGAVDLVFSEIELPRNELDWKTAMRRRAASLRAALLRHRWAIGLMDSRTSPGPATLRHHDAVLGRCRAAGFSLELSAHAFFLIDSYVYGFVLQEISLPAGDGDELAELAGSIMTSRAMEEFPHLRELTIDHVLRVGYSYDREFDFGLDLILDGLEETATREGSPDLA